MCGIAGYTGKKHAASILIETLKRLEHRGYDSCGIAFVIEKELNVVKTTGKISNLEKLIKNQTYSTTGIGHTRWATHGKVSFENTHPHIDCKKCIAVVHNGIIENYREIKQFLTPTHKFISSTDTEVIPHLIEHYLNQGKNIRESFFLTIKQLKGSFAIAMIFAEEEKIYFAQINSSLVIYKGDDETYLVSDPLGLPLHATKVIQVNDDQWGIITAKNVYLFDQDGNQKKPKFFSLKHKVYAPVEHFFLKEILEQPFTILSALRNTILFYDLGKNFFKGIEKIILTGCGSSYYAALIGKYYFETISKIDSRAEYSSEMINSSGLKENNTMIIALSQSGETRDTISAIEKIKGKILAITNVDGSLITRLTPYNIIMGAGPEISVAATKSFTSQVVCLYVYLS